MHLHICTERVGEGKGESKTESETERQRVKLITFCKNSSSHHDFGMGIYFFLCCKLLCSWKSLFGSLGKMTWKVKVLFSSWGKRLPQICVRVTCFINWVPFPYWIWLSGHRHFPSLYNVTPISSRNLWPKLHNSILLKRLIKQSSAFL